MVPFAVYSEPPEKPERGELPRVPSGGLHFGPAARLGDQLYLESDECSDFCALITRLPTFASKPRIDDQAAGGFRAGSGLHLMDLRERGSDDAEEVVMNKIEALDDSVSLWQTCSLCLLKARFSDELWWKEVSLEQLWEIRLQRCR